MFEEDTDCEELQQRLQIDTNLVKKGQGYIVDVFLFDNHFQTAKKAKVRVIAMP